MTWWQRLRDAILAGRRQLAGPDADPETELETCLHEHIRPALESVREQLASEGFEASLDTRDEEVELRVINYNELPLVYRAEGFIFKQPVVNLASMGKPDSLERFPRIRIESGGRTREYRTGQCHREAIEEAAMAYYRKFLMRRGESA